MIQRPACPKLTLGRMPPSKVVAVDELELDNACCRCCPWLQRVWPFTEAQRPLLRRLRRSSSAPVAQSRCDSQWERSVMCHAVESRRVKDQRRSKREPARGGYPYHTPPNCTQKQGSRLLRSVPPRCPAKNTTVVSMARSNVTSQAARAVQARAHQLRPASCPGHRCRCCPWRCPWLAAEPARRGCGWWWRWWGEQRRQRAALQGKGLVLRAPAARRWSARRRRRSAS